MKGLLFMIALLFSVVCFASPPNEVKVFKPDKTFVAQANDVVSCTINTAIVEQDFALDAPAKELSIETTKNVTINLVVVREVAYPLKISVTKAESGVATENAIMALNSTCTENRAFKIPPLLCSANVVTNKGNFVRNLQHCNYGYPLSARTKIFFS